jgi:hypothetical protein
MFNFNLDPNTLLALEILALVLLVVLTVWGIGRKRRLARNTGTADMHYDMRRDGPQLGA